MKSIEFFARRIYVRRDESTGDSTMTEEFDCGHALSQAYGALAPVDPVAVHTALERAGVTRLYPDFEDWFFGKVVPGMRSGERCVMTSVIDSVLAGVAICKRTETERKLCTFWVSPHVRGRGVAAELAGEAFDWLGTAKPLFTVPEERYAEFGGLLRSWSFSKPVRYGELYRPNRLEYVFNGGFGGMAH